MTKDLHQSLYIDELSDELPFFAQARPRRMICLQYKSGPNITAEMLRLKVHSGEHFIALIAISRSGAHVANNLLIQSTQAIIFGANIYLLHSLEVTTL